VAKRSSDERFKRRDVGPDTIGERGWFTHNDCAAFLGISWTQLATKYVPMLAEVDVRKHDGRRLIRGRALVDVFARTDRPPGRLPQSAMQGEDADLFQSGSSPALEKYRAARAEMVELELATKRRSLVPRHEMADVLTVIADRLRSATEQIERRFGRDAAEIIAEALDDAGREIESLAAPGETAHVNGTSNGKAARKPKKNA